MKIFKHVFLFPVGERKIYIEGYLAGVDGEVTISDPKIIGVVNPAEILSLPLEVSTSRVRDLDGWRDCPEELAYGILGQVIEPLLAVRARTMVRS